ncbi:MAG TPA: VWA domain-containing protein [Pyrinomonadaceae bacterium]|nr:VWA domain-containing protein [Pyrinomonadaceae bacterium]
MVRIFSLCLTTAVLLTSSLAGIAQMPREPQKRNTRQITKPKPEASPASSPENPAADQNEVETIKINTDLVVVPVIATDLNGLYIPDLKRDEFFLEEDGIKQEIAFFATISAPFHVVLMLDTSASTQEKLTAIQRAATAFVEQLKTGDLVKVISFDDQVRDLNDFTSDRGLLKAAINNTQPGRGTKLYDAMALAISSVRRIQGRKAIVLFSDGVDWHSDDASFDGTLRGLDEEGVIVYPIRYDTRAETEQLARQQAEDITPQLPTIGVIRKPPSGTTAPTFPGEGDTVPTTGTRPKTGPLGLPLPAEIMRRRRESDPNRFPSPDGIPPSGRDPNGLPAPETRPTSRPDGGIPDRTSYPRRRRPAEEDNSISAMLDSLYMTADGYLKTLAEKSGGRVLRADTLLSLPDAFGKIAAELRTQYAIGYYPSNRARDDKYRRIRVTTPRKGAVIRSRPGYQR